MVGVAEKLRNKERIPLVNLHEGIKAYLHHKNGWLPLYPSLSTMPYEAAEVLEYCLTSEQLDSSQDTDAMNAYQTSMASYFERFLR